MSKLAPLSIQQIPLDQMEHGLARPIATFKLEPAEIARRAGVRFEAARDDLDDLQAAVICTGTGRQFALVRHLHQPEAGTDILTNENSRDLVADLRIALQILQFGQRDLRWTHPDIDLKHLRFASSVREAPRRPSKVELNYRKLAPDSAVKSKIRQLLRASGTKTISVHEIARKLGTSRRLVSAYIAAAKRRSARFNKDARKTKKVFQ